MNILYLSYACEPGAGSEYGVGWMMPLTMAEKYPEHHIHVLTRSRCKEKIQNALDALKLDNLHYHFYDIPRILFYKNEMTSKWGEQINYLTWQLFSRKNVKKIVKANNIDIVHHLTFNQYRTPSPGFWLKKTPFIMGPIGGAETISEVLWQDLEEHTMTKEGIRAKGRDLRIFRWLIQRSRNKKIILCSSIENEQKLKPYVGDNVIKTMPAIGYALKDVAVESQTKKEIGNFEIVYAGKALDWKGIHLFLRAVRKAFIENDISKFNIKLIGIRFKEEQDKVNGWIKELDLQNNTELIPFIQRQDLLQIEKDCDLSVYPAFRDSGSMAVLETCALGCPTICLNAGGQDAFPDNILLKIDVQTSYDKTVECFAEQLKWAYCNREELHKIGEAAKKWVENNLTWDKKAEQILKLYAGL